MPATDALVERLAATMRKPDQDECRALGTEPLEALRASMRASEAAWALVFHEEPAAAWGVVPMRGLPGFGGIWLLTGESVENHKARFQFVAASELIRLLERWPVLVNYVDARYTRAINWLHHLGAHLGAPQPIGPLGSPFHPLVITKEGFHGRR